jgi:hypothetical protein
VRRRPDRQLPARRPRQACRPRWRCARDPTCRASAVLLVMPCRRLVLLTPLRLRSLSSQSYTVP